MKNQKIYRLIHCCLLLMLLVTMLAPPAYAASGDVAGVVSDIWKDASGQIKSICNNVVFPACSILCGVGFAISLILAAVNFKKHHTIEVGWPIALLIGLLFSLTAQTWVWNLVGL